MLSYLDDFLENTHFNILKDQIGNYDTCEGDTCGKLALPLLAFPIEGRTTVDEIGRHDVNMEISTQNNYLLHSLADHLHNADWLYFNLLDKFRTEKKYMEELPDVYTLDESHLEQSVKNQTEFLDKIFTAITSDARIRSLEYINQILSEDTVIRQGPVVDILLADENMPSIALNGYVFADYPLKYLDSSDQDEYIFGNSYGYTSIPKDNLHLVAIKDLDNVYFAHCDQTGDINSSLPVFLAATLEDQDAANAWLQEHPLQIHENLRLSGNIDSAYGTLFDKEKLSQLFIRAHELHETLSKIIDEQEADLPELSDMKDSLFHILFGNSSIL